MNPIDSSSIKHHQQPMITVKVSKEIESVCPHFVGACVEAQVLNTNFCQPLWDEINALIRRMLQGKQLYQIDTLVDLINLASIAYGYSIGGFDADKFQGDTLTLGIGREGEPYEGIGRGRINIHGLPVYRDEVGGVGTPTSDNERTKIDLHTTHLVVLINGYDGNEQRVSDNATFIQELLRKYCESDGGSFYLYR